HAGKERRRPWALALVGARLDVRDRLLERDHRPDASVNVSLAMKLSVLDQSPISEGMSCAQALANKRQLARLADSLGYHRYWVAEHHGGPMLAGPSPEVL